MSDGQALDHPCGIAFLRGCSKSHEFQANVGQAFDLSEWVPCGEVNILVLKSAPRGSIVLKYPIDGLPNPGEQE